MIEISNADVFGFRMAVKGIRNSYKVNDKSDSYTDDGEFYIGKKDMALCKRLMAGTPERKFLRMIHVQADVKAPLYWWKQYATYKIATTENSESTMHTLTRGISVKDFSPCETAEGKSVLYYAVNYITALMNTYNNETDVKKKKKLEHDLFVLLPDGYLQLRTIDVNYETLIQIYTWRKNHKLSEWHTFCDWIETLPYMKAFLEALNERKNS